MVNTRESLGDFESSLFDASDGHKLVELIRKKKGLQAKPQKIFDDVPSYRHSLNIEFQRLDNKTEKSTEKDPIIHSAAENPTTNATEICVTDVAASDPAPIHQPSVNTTTTTANNDPATNQNAANTSKGILSNSKFVPKSPRRTFVTTRPSSSPIIKINSKTLGRRTLLKEFEKAFLNESRFQPEICSTPITTDCINEENHRNKNVPKKVPETPEEDIICSPITISDEDEQNRTQNRTQNQTLMQTNNSEKIITSLIRQTNILNAMLQNSETSQNATLLGKENPIINKSPRRTYTVECDITTGQITLSPAKSTQNKKLERTAVFSPKRTPLKNSQPFTRKLIATPEQRKVLLSRLGLAMPETAQKTTTTAATENWTTSNKKTSRIPIFSSKINTNNCSTNQQVPSEGTAEFIERLQKNATPNSPVIVIPVNQTFNQVPPGGHSIPEHRLPPLPEIDIPHNKIPANTNEITSTISDSTSKTINQNLRPILNDALTQRVDSPVSNVISSTTFSGGEQQQPTQQQRHLKNNNREPHTSNLNWQDILTDDASTSDHSCESSGMRHKNRKLSRTRKKQTKQSITCDKKKLSLNSQCLDLRMRVDSDGQSEKRLQQPVQETRRTARQLEEQHQHTNKLLQISQKEHHQIEKEKIVQQKAVVENNNVQPKSRRETYVVVSRQREEKEEKTEKENGSNLQRISLRRFSNDSVQNNTSKPLDHTVQQDNGNENNSPKMHNHHPNESNQVLQEDFVRIEVTSEKEENHKNNDGKHEQLSSETNKNENTQPKTFSKSNDEYQHKSKHQCQSRRDTSKFDADIDRLLRTIHGDETDVNILLPPDEFCDRFAGNFRDTDLIDEEITDRVLLSQENRLKVPSVAPQQKKRRNKKIPEDVKEYLETDRRLSKKQFLSISKRRLYNKGESDFDTSDGPSFLKKPKKSSISNQHDRKSARQSGHHKSPKSRISSRRKDCDNDSENDIEQTKKRKSRRKTKQTECYSSKNKNLDEVDKSGCENNTSRLSRSTSRSFNTTTNYKNLNKHKNNKIKQNQKATSKHFSRLLTPATNFSDSSSSSDYEDTSKRTNDKFYESKTKKDHKTKLQSQREVRDSSSDGYESNIESNISLRSSIITSSSLPKKSSKQPSNEHVVSAHQKEVYTPQSCPSPPPPTSLKSNKRQTSEPTIVNEKIIENNIVKEVESSNNVNSKTKVSKKTKQSKKTQPVINISSPIVDYDQQTPQDGELRRSKREKKPPTAYWCDTNAGYTNVYDIYSMLTAKSKKSYFPDFILPKKSKKNIKEKENENEKLPSTDDNLVANTNTNNSSSSPKQKASTKSKKQSKQTKKKETESTKFQSDSEKGTHIPNFQDTPSECPTESYESSSSSTTATNKPRSRQKKQKPTQSTTNKDLNNKPQSSDYPQTEEDALSLQQKQQLPTIPEYSQMTSNQEQELDNNTNSKLRLSGTLMPPPTTSVIKKIKKSNKSKQKNTFHTEHDKSIADVSSEHLNNLFEQLKNSSIYMQNNKREVKSTSKQSSGQVSLDNRSSGSNSSSSTNKKRNNNSSQSINLSTNGSVHLKQRLNNVHNTESSSELNERNFDSGFSSEDMNSINPKKDILLDWLVQILNNGKTPSNSQKGLARFLEPNGYQIANVDELTFEEIDGVDFAFYNKPGHKFGYLRFKPHTQKKISSAKRYELNFILLGGTIKMTVDKQTFNMKNGDLITIYIGTSYRMENVTDDPALVMVIKN